MALIPCIAVSTGYILFCLFWAELLRSLIHKVLPGDGSGLIKIAILEALAAAELCGCCFELIIIADNYGVGTYAIYLFSLTIWWGMKWGDSTACPYFHFESCLTGSMTLLETAVRTLAEVIGGVAIFKYVQVLWGMEMAETHVGRSHSAAFDNCSADLQVSILYGAIIEGIATMLCRLTSKFLSDKEPQYASAIDSFVATFLVVAAFDYSGGYYNPVLATSLKFGCRGHSYIEHIIVYWIGASLGAIASVYVYPPLKALLIKEKTE